MTPHSMDEHHEKYLRRYVTAMRALFILSKAEYLPSPDDGKLKNSPQDSKSQVAGETPRENQFPGPPLTPLSILYARTLVTTTRRVFSWGVPSSEALEMISGNSPRGVIEIGAGTGLWTSLLRKKGVHVDAIDMTPMGGREGEMDVGEHEQSEHALLKEKSLSSTGNVKNIEQEPATQNVNGHHGVRNENPPPFANVRLGDVSSIAGHTGGGLAGDANNVPSLFMCWPPREERGDEYGTEEPSGNNKTPPNVTGMALDALRAYRGNTLLYVGEVDVGTGGTGSDGQDGSQSTGKSSGNADTTHGTARITATAGPLFHSELVKNWHNTHVVPLPNWPGTYDALTVWKRKGTKSAPKRAPPSRADSTGFVEPNQIERSVTEKKRLSMLNDTCDLFEQATAQLINRRVQNGGHRSLRGVERHALTSLRKKSNWFRRAALAFL
mmetsp:Transcript_9019/g.33650  ORF Transcript_9019/g.33650 Transcript_9019/m.33650 type:complete len:439 (-) Transcript_9019:273-1589(-)